MKIHVVGAGPAGLYFSILMKRLDPRHEIEVFERNPPDATFGWGVVFSARTLSILEKHDPESARATRRQAALWENVVIVHPDETFHVGGNHFTGVSRLSLLRVLQERAAELGVQLHFEREIEDISSLRDCDLVLGADGVFSRVRDAYAEVLRPTVEPRRNTYIWLGTKQPFNGLSLIFRPSEHGVFIAHSYRYCEDTSTFIVECDEGTARKAALADRDEASTLALLEEVFAKDLGGHPLLSNRSMWIRFMLVRNERWIHENVVLVGDACHTAHFSIGSGTKQAMEDVIALAGAFRDHAAVPAALSAYQERRKPVVDDLQEAAMASLHWFETAHQRLDQPPLDFAMECMTRSEKLDLERLRRRDSSFVERWEASRQG